MKYYEEFGSIGGQCAAVDPNDDFHEPLCPNEAVAWRESWRFGTGDEPLIVNTRYAICRDHYDQWLDNQLDGEAEARMS